MPVRIAEYLGQRTDVDEPAIRPTALKPNVAPTCPFLGQPCTKLTGKKSYPPVCSVRKGNGSLFVVCSDRIVPARSRTLTVDHLNLLGSVSAILFPEAIDDKITFKRQSGIKLPDGVVYLDYVLRVADDAYPGRKAAIVEIQGGGETSNTGTLTSHVESWAQTPGRTNEQLRELHSKVGIIPDNAWKRQLRQIFRKAPIAARFDGAFALVLGPNLFDYVVRSVSEGTDWFPDWEVALVEVVEKADDRAGSIPLRTGRSVFMTYKDFVMSVSEGVLPADLQNPFKGQFTSMTNVQVQFTD